MLRRSKSIDLTMIFSAVVGEDRADHSDVTFVALHHRDALKGGESNEGRTVATSLAACGMMLDSRR